MISALKNAGRTLSNGETPAAMRCSDSEASKRVREVADLLELGWAGRYRTIALKARTAAASEATFPACFRAGPGHGAGLASKVKCPCENRTLFRIAQSESDCMKGLSDRVAKLFTQKAAAMDRANRFVRGGLILLGALLAGASQLLPSASPNAVGWSAIPLNQIAGWVGALLALAGGIWSLWVDETVPGALEEAREAIERAKEAEAAASALEATREQEKQDLRYSLGWLSLLYACLPSFREVVGESIATK